MYERKYGLLYCPGCMCGQMFIALVCDGVPRNLSGEKVRHITDASCRECGYSYGRKDVRDEASGHVLKGMKVIDDATAIAAARAAGLPAAAALDHFVPGEPGDAAPADAVAAPPPGPAAADASSRPPPAAASSLRSAAAPSPGPDAASLRSPPSEPAPAGASLRSPPAGAPAGRGPDFVGPRPAGLQLEDDGAEDSLDRFLRQHSAAG